MQQPAMFKDEPMLVEQLTELMQHRTPDTALIVSCGPVYWMQWVANKTSYLRNEGAPLPDHIFWQAVGNEALPPEYELNYLQEGQLRMLGFEYPCSPHPVYQFYTAGFVRILDHFDTETIATVAHISCYTFAYIYRCPSHLRLNFTLEPTWRHKRRF